MPWRTRSPLPYADLPGFPRPTVEGHDGRIVLGRLEGLPVACLQGRVHLYEGVPASAVNVLVRTLKALGCEILVLTNAAGSLRPEIGAGTVALIADHINLQGQNPLVGANDAAIGPRFPDLSEVYDPALREQLARIAEGLGIELASGVYLAVWGRASRLRPRSALSGRWAPIWSACRPCPRRSARGMPGCACRAVGRDQPRRRARRGPALARGDPGPGLGGRGQARQGAARVLPRARRWLSPVPGRATCWSGPDARRPTRRSPRAPCRCSTSPA